MCDSLFYSQVIEMCSTNGTAVVLKLIPFDTAFVGDLMLKTHTA